MPPEVLHLSPEQIDAAATFAVEQPGKPNLINGRLINPTTVDQESLDALAEAVEQKQKDRKQFGERTRVLRTEATDDENGTLPGGFTPPDGYEYVGQFQSDQDTVLIPIEGLDQITKIEEMAGVSVTLERSYDTSAGAHRTDGVLRCRMIEDKWARVYIFRKDEDGVTTIKVGQANG